MGRNKSGGDTSRVGLDETIGHLDNIQGPKSSRILRSKYLFFEMATNESK